jgi:hypothetical protein
VTERQRQRKREREKERERERGSQVVLKSEDKMDLFEHYNTLNECVVRLCKWYILPVQTYIAE